MATTIAVSPEWTLGNTTFPLISINLHSWSRTLLSHPITGLKLSHTKMHREHKATMTQLADGIHVSSSSIIVSVKITVLVKEISFWI